MSEVDDLDPTEATEALVAYLGATLGANVIVGPASSDRSFDAYAVAAPLDVLLISPSATSPLLTEVDGVTNDDQDPGLFWRTVPPDGLQGKVVAWDIEGRGVTDVAIVHEESSYASALADVIEAELSIAPVRFAFDNPTLRGEAIVDAGNAGVQEVVFLTAEADDLIAFFEAAAISEDYTGADPIEIFLADAGADPFVLQSAPTAIETLMGQIRGTRPQVPSGDVFETFQAAYVGAYGEDPGDAVFAPYTYDAAWLAIYGHAWSLYQEGEISGTGVARGLRQVSSAAEVSKIRPGSWEVVSEAFQQGVSVDVEGASGELDFDPTTGETSGPIEVWITDGTGFAPVRVCQPDGSCEDVIPTF
jgi:branched-chain amino acid transport system substrate-binding protein